jgi:diacylglycerol O-acyltransferase / wax synthase
MGVKKLNPLDASWLYVDSTDTPMHVASLLIFSLPEGAPEDFLRKLVTQLKSGADYAAPWNLKLKSPALRRVLPSWTEDSDLDIDYHIRHSALPKPGGERELGMLVSRLHSHQLDFARPLWEAHIIEGLEGNRFALYTKMHHSLVDGISGMRMLQRTMGTSAAASKKLPPPWTSHAPVSKKAMDDEIAPTPDTAVKSMFGGLRKQFRSVPDLARGLGRLVKSAGGGKSALTVPFGAPSSVLNGRITGSRRFGTQQYDLAQLKALAKKADVTLNDVVLWLCSTALRRFLKEANALPNKSLTAGIPVNVRPADDHGTGNAISFIMATLATDIADPRKRLDAIRESTARAKAHLQSLPRDALTQYTMLVMAPFILELITGLGGRTRPVFNVTISNVPGPEQPLYFHGARLEAMYPVSLLAHGQAINITCVSYAGKLNFGFTGARDTLPHMQRLSVYTGEALEELEEVLA